MNMIIEICANSIESAKAAQDGGADRIELCTELSVGGLTPTHDLIEKVITKLKIPVHVLVRPRSGDFVYSKAELEGMLVDIAFCKKIGCFGIVSGALSLDNTIDEKAAKQLVSASEGMQFTFHRAFDLVKNPSEAIETLLRLGVTRLLSSGQQNKAIDGIELLKQLKSLSEEKLQIMPGSGINTRNVMEFKKAGFEMIHLSAISNRTNVTASNSFFETGIEGTSDVKIIRKVVRMVTGITK